MPQSRLMGNAPTTNNLLKETGFSFACSYIPDTVFHLQTAQIPSITGQPIEVGTPLTALMVPGDVLKYEQLNITFLVDEELANFRELQNWMRKLYTADNTDQLRGLKNEDFITDNLGGGTTEATLTVRSNKQNPTLRCIFQDIYPVSLGELQFTTASQDADELVCQATFAYNTYSLKYLNE